MRVAVAFEKEQLDLDIADDRLVAAWEGPAGVAPEEVPAHVARTLEHPEGFPPLRQAVVPGDRVVIAVGPDLPEPGLVLDGVVRVLNSSGIEPGTITLLADLATSEGFAAFVPPGLTFQRHDPDDRTSLAYLATTAGDRRVYLNRLLTDADFVLPIGRMAHDPILGLGGPWGVIYPGLSDTATRRAVQESANEQAPGPGRGRRRPALDESNEVSWLLGSQFQLGLVPGVNGLLAAVGGLGSAVLDRGETLFDDAWGVRVESRAELVIVGVGRPGTLTGLTEVAQGLETAMKLVQRGGKIVVLSRAEGPIGNATRRLIDRDDPRSGPASLRGLEAEGDYGDARRIARALAWADVYLLSALGSDVVEDLGMIPLDRAEEARRLAAVSGSCLVVSHADRARATVIGEAG